MRGNLQGFFDTVHSRGRLSKTRALSDQTGRRELDLDLNV